MATTYKEQPSTFIEENKQYFNLLIVTATDIEKKELHQRLRPIAGETQIMKVQKNQHTYYLGQFGQYNVVHVATADMGAINRGAAITTTMSAIQQWSPKAVLMVGIAFGADPDKVRIGDVLISERVVNYESARVNKNGSVLSRAKEGPASSLLLDRFKSVDGWKHEVKVPHLVNSYDAKFLSGLILSGEKLVDNKKFKSALLKREPSAIGGEMEGAGIYAACDGRVPHWILVKGVCDYGDGEKDKNKNLFQELAVSAAASLCEHVFNSPHAFDDIELYSGVIGAKADDKDTKKKVLDPLTAQMQRQIAKQKASEKYIPDTFIEVDDNKEMLRFFCHPCLFVHRIAGEMALLDFAPLHPLLAQYQFPAFEYDPSFMQPQLEDISVNNMAARAKGWQDYVAAKANELENPPSPKNSVSTFGYKLSGRLNYFKWLGYQVCLITEDAGQGKTNFLCDLAERFLLPHEIPSVFLLGTELAPADIRKSILAKVYPDDPAVKFSDFLAAMQMICEQHNKPFVIVIDGINESGNPRLLSQNLEAFLSEVIAHPFVKVIITCRTEYFDHNFSNLSKSAFKDKIGTIDHLRSRDPRGMVSEKLFDTYLNYFDIKYNNISNKAYGHLAGNFLLLRIFCDAYRKQSLGYIDNIYKQELFARYYQQKTQEINQRMNNNDEFRVGHNIDIGKFLSKIVEYMVAHKKFTSIPLDKLVDDVTLRQVYVRFLDENILVRRDPPSKTSPFDTTEVVNFTYDEFRDYLISDYLIKVVYPDDLVKFEGFISKALIGGSAILEGCGTFLFFHARQSGDKKLIDMIESQPWFASMFLRCIFALEDKYITPDDRKNIFAYLASHPEQGPRLFYAFTGRADRQLYPNLNLGHYLEYLRSLDPGKYHEVFTRHFHSDRYESRGIRQTDLLNRASEALEGREEISNRGHALMERLPYMFLNGQAHEVKAVYESYYYRYPAEAVAHLKMAKTAVNKAMADSIDKFCKRYGISL